MRNENTELKKRINDFSSVENAKKKLEAKVETLEQKVRLTGLIIWRHKLTLFKMDALIQDKVSQKANELTATYDEKLRNYDER